ncbi:hypothetical protein BJ508DRAFT_365581, partial [Ascobolus immersus RN42]
MAQKNNNNNTAAAAMSKRKMEESGEAAPSPAPRMSAMSALAARRARQNTAPEVVVPEPTPPPPPPTPTVRAKQTRKKPVRRPSQQDAGKKTKPDDPPIDVDVANPFALLMQPATLFNNRTEDVMSDVSMEEVEERGAPVEVRLSTFEPTEGRVVREAERLGFGLREGETLCLAGLFSITVTAGAVSILNTTISAGGTIGPVYAPVTHALPVIRCVGAAAEFMVGSVRSSVTEVDRIAPQFRNIWTLPTTPRLKAIAPSGGTFTVVLATSLALTALDPAPAWTDALATLSTPPTLGGGEKPKIILLTGAKGTGKSTLSRLLLNALLPASPSGICFLDLDPGQPEFGPSTILSLSHITSPILGPSFTHSSRASLLRLHYGYTSAAADPDYYKTCTARLFAAYRTHLERMPGTPLVVNTSGWIKGIGLELLQSFLTSLHVTHLLHLESTPNGPFLPPDLAETLAMPKCSSITTTLLPGATAGGGGRFTSADLRLLQMSYYLHATPPGASAAGHWDFGTRLTHTRPYLLPFSALRAVEVLGERIVPEEVVTAVDCTIVGLISTTTSSSAAIVQTPEGIPFIPEAGPNFEGELVALGVVRGVDVERGELHVLVGGADLERWE